MRIVANGIAIEVDDQGPASGEPLLLIMGLGMQLIGWPDELVQELITRGFRVIRMDNRDIGLSQHFDEHGVPNLPWAALRFAMHLPISTPYSVADMAADAIGVLDALGVQRAHVCGASMGGMVAQHLAARHAQRVKSLVLLMSSSGARSLPQPTMAVRRALLSRPDGHDRDAVLRHFVRLLGVIGSPGYPPEPARLQQRLQTMVNRSYHPAGTARQLVAVAADGDRSAMLARITAPTHVIHGEADVLIPVAAGFDLARKVAGSTQDIVPGMGHDLPLALLPRYADGIAANARRAR
jgi:pimeloyl-ACP methyl ester carboxylesterase